MQRRNYLKAVGALGIGSIAATGTASAATHTLTIRGVGPTAQYSLAVEDNLTKSTANGANINSNDERRAGTAHGEVGTSSDSYEFSGELFALNVLGGGANITLDGQSINERDYPNHALVIEGAGEATSYTFTVSSGLSKATVGPANLNGNDEIVRQSATGEVGISADAYTFDGPLYSFDFDRSGAVNVTLDGEAGRVGRRPDHTVTIIGKGPTAEYSTTVSRNLEKSTAYNASINDNDMIDGNTAEGEVGIGRDSYTYDGEITDFTAQDVTVLLDGERVGQGTVGN
jgi:hypothetical protein